MVTLINLNKARKARERAAAEAQAAENRVVHGRTKTEKLADQAVKARTIAHLDGKKRDL